MSALVHRYILVADLFCRRESVTRRVSFPLREGHKAAYLCTDSTKYRYLTEMAAPKRWFRDNVDAVMREFGAEHHIQREDLHLGKLPLHYLKAGADSGSSNWHSGS